ncbi:hypothetical protein EB634_00495 [Escherichia coli]|nr:hypothetical protein [Escherichia coli]
MESNIKGLVAAGHEMASELKAECGAVDMRSVAKLISDLATQLEVQLVRANALAEDQQKAIESIKQADAAVKLAHEKFSALALPDARGDFIRIWDDGRGIDVGRTLLSGQSHTIMDHAHNMELWTGDGLAAGSAREGVNPGILATYGDGGIVKTDEPGLRVPSSLRALSSRSVKRYGEISGNVGTETRPRNIAFNFLVRAK